MSAAVPWRPLLLASLLAGTGCLAAWAGRLASPPAAAAGLVAYALTAAVVALRFRSPVFGAANLVTLLRVVGTCWVLVLVLGPSGVPPTDGGIAPALVVAVGTACLVLDGVDGRLARARAEASDFGARFDMETDAALLLVLSAAVSGLGYAGWWVLAIGGMRYAYGAAAVVVPALRRPLAPRLSGRVVAVVQGVALLLALALGGLGAPGWLISTVLLAALGALCWSFGRTIAGQLRALPA